MNPSKTMKRIQPYGIVALIGIAGICALTGNPTAYADDMQNLERVDIDLSASTPESRLLNINDRCDRVFTIASTGKSAYVRISPTLESPDFECSLTFESPRSSNWVCAKDGWWYSTSPIGGGQSENAATSFQIIPSDGLLEALGNSGEARIDECVIAQAIDAEGLDLDFAADEPWGKGAFTEAGNEGKADEEIIETIISEGIEKHSRGHGASDFNPTGDSCINLILPLTALAVLSFLSACILRRLLTRKRNSEESDAGKTDFGRIGA